MPDPYLSWKRVSRWTYSKVKKIDIFSYLYIMFPINMRTHWSAAVIVNPGSTEVLYIIYTVVHVFIISYAF